MEALQIFGLWDQETDSCFKNYEPLIPTLLFKENFIDSVKGYEYFHKLISQFKNDSLNFLKSTMYMHTVPLIKL